MHELLRDSIWTFVGAVLALIAIGATFWVYALQRPRKRLLIERVARVPLVTIGTEKIEGLEVKFNGDVLESASVIVVRITNSGNQPITAEEFERPVTLIFEEGAAVLHAEISEPSPKGLVVATSSQGRELQIERCLLNPGDTFLCRALVRDSKGRYEPAARVVGMKDIETSRAVSIARPVAMASCVAVAFVAYTLSPTPKSISPTELRPEEMPYLVALLLAMLTLSVLTLGDLKARLRSMRDRLNILAAKDA